MKPLKLAALERVALNLQHALALFSCPSPGASLRRARPRPQWAPSRRASDIRLAALAGLAVALGAQSALACSACGCNLNTDESTEGPQAGWSIDERLDYVNQNSLWQGGGKAASNLRDPSIGDFHEVEKATKTFFYTTTLDYAAEDPWGVNVAIPAQYRLHSTYNAGDGSWDKSKSSWNDLGDIRITGRYMGLTEDHDFGIQAGIKLPTGKTNEVFYGATANQQVDRGLQPGTGSWDALLGFIKNGQATPDIQWFMTGLWDKPLNSYANFRIGQTLTGTLGARYTGWQVIVPQLQINAQNRWRDTGTMSLRHDSGGEIVNLSPGAFVNVSDAMSVYGFVQLPVYQRVGGLQLVPQYSASIGVRYHF